MSTSKLPGPAFGELIAADERALTSFIEQAIPEGPTLDYKADIPGDLAQTVSAMANTDGGTIVVGVAEDAKTKKPSTSPGIAVRDPQGQVTNVLRAYLDPVPEFDTAVIPRSEGGSYVVIVIRPSKRRVVLHRDRGILVRIGDQSVAPTRAEFERLVDRERARTDEIASARDAASESIMYWVSADTTGTPRPIWITAGLVPVAVWESPLDESSDRALLGAAQDLLLPSWELVQEPDSSTLRRGEETVVLQRSGERRIRFLSERPGWDIDPPWAINALDLAGDIACCLLMPFRMGDLDPRLDYSPWVGAISISGIAARRLFFLDRDRYSPPKIRETYPGIVRTGVLSEPADAVALASRVVADLARLHSVAGFDTWAPGLGPRLTLHHPRLSSYTGRLGA